MSYTFDAQWTGGYESKVLVKLEHPKTTERTDNGRLIVEIKNESGDWSVPDGWPEEIELRENEQFCWGSVSSNFYIQLVRWLEVQLHVHGSLSPVLVSLLMSMDKEDMASTAEAIERFAEAPSWA